MRASSRAAIALVIVVVVAIAESVPVGAQQPQLRFDPPFGACQDAELTIRGEGFPAGTTVALFGGAAEGPALDRFALTVEQPEVDAGGAFELTLERLPILCTMERVGIFALAELPTGQVVAQARAVYFVAIEPPASGNSGAAGNGGRAAGGAASTVLALVALALTLVGAGIARRKARGER